MSVLSVILVICLQMTRQFADLLSRSNERIGVQQEGNRALALMVNQLRQAMLDQRPLLVGSSGEPVLAGEPERTLPWSDLMFICGPDGVLLPAKEAPGGHAVFFQAPLGNPAQAHAGRAFNEIGYYIDLNDGDPPPFVLARPKRLRLMQYRRRFEDTTVRAATKAARAGEGERGSWFQVPVGAGEDVQPVATNVLAMIIVPKVRGVEGLVPLPPQERGWSLFPGYLFDSQADGPRQHLPPELVEITLIVGGEESLNRHANRHPGTAFDFGQSLLFSEIQSADQYQSGLDELIRRLNDANIYHQIFTTTVRIEAGSHRL